VTLAARVANPMHALRPFVVPVAGGGGGNRGVATAHLRIARAASRADPVDYFVKRTSFLGLSVSFFHWQQLHYLFDEIFVDRCYAFTTGSPSPRIIDAGANIGMATLWFSRTFPGARITAIEPDPSTCALLKRNVSENGLDQVTPVQAALSDAEGEIELLVQAAMPGDLRMSVQADRMKGSAAREASTVRVPAMRLSTFADEPIDFLKLDIEGAELPVMEEMASSGALENVRAMSMEYHHHLDPDTDRLGDMLSLLEKARFTYRISAPSASPAVSPQGIAKFQDIAILAVRRPDGTTS
jgi:FkbM family methyltransferase